MEKHRIWTAGIWCFRLRAFMVMYVCCTQAMSTDLRAAEMRAADLAGEAAAAQDAAASWRSEAEQLRGLLRQMDADRDNLQVRCAGQQRVEFVVSRPSLRTAWHCS